MPKIARYKNKDYYIPDGGTYITPNGKPDEEYEVKVSQRDRDRLQKDITNQSLIARIKRQNRI